MKCLDFIVLPGLAFPDVARGWLLPAAWKAMNSHNWTVAVLIAFLFFSEKAPAQGVPFAPRSTKTRALPSGKLVQAERLKVTLRDAAARDFAGMLNGQQRAVSSTALTSLHPEIIEIDPGHTTARQWLKGEPLAERFRTEDGSLPRRARRFDVVLRPGADVLKVKAELEQHPSIERVDLKHVLELDSVPNDANYGQLWAPPITGLERAWDFPARTRARVAVIDSGLQTSHPEFANRVVFSVGYADFETGEAPIQRAMNDDFDHGTHVAGILCATRNNGVGVAGYSNEIDLMVLNCAAWDEGKRKFLISNADNAIDDAVANGAIVINCSFGFSDDSLQDEVEDAYAADVLVVHAAGNDSASITGQWHAGSNAVLTVTATMNVVPAPPALPRDDFDNNYSNFGAGVDLAAPGTSIFSTVPGGYGFKQGTSMAAPQVSGAAALLITMNPRIGDQSARHLLIRMAEDRGPTGYDEQYGFGNLRLREGTVRAVRDATAFVSSASTAARETGNYDLPWKSIPAALANVPDQSVLVLNGGTTDVSIYNYPAMTITKPCTLTAIPDRPALIGTN